MAAKNAYVEWIAEWLSPLGEITSRSMMGGHVLYCNGIVFALVADGTLYLKADAETRPKFQALGLKAFQPFPDKPGTMSYCTPPPEFFEDADVMKEWGREAVAVGMRAKGKKGKARKKAAK
jgi:DNA transformation protein